jgi:methyl-accepting chemotaxis protein
MKRPWTRRNYFIKREVQGRYLFIAFAFAVTELVLFVVLLGASQADKLTVSYEDHNLRVAQAPLAFFEQVLGAHWIFIVLGGLALGLGSLLLTHRFAGPMYRFEKTLEQMIRGNLATRVRLRTRDEGAELAALMNRFNDEMSASLGEMRAGAEAIRASLRLASKARKTAEIKALVGRAEESTRRLAEKLESYELKHG